MNTFADYKELEDNIVDWLDRQDIRDKVPAFIRLITVDAARELRIPTMEKTTVVELYADGSATIPSDLVEVRNVNYVKLTGQNNIASRIPLNRASQFEYQKSRETDNYKDTQPTSFSRIEGDFKIFPLPAVEDKVLNGSVYNPDVIGHVEIVYFALPNTINDPAEKNWILQVAPDIYFYGGLMHGYRYIRDYESSNYFEQKYNTAVKQLQGSVNIAEWAGGPIVVGTSDEQR